MKPTNSRIYFERAADSAQQAEDATLDNVRDRNLRSEAAWRSMAETASVLEAEREKRDVEKAEHEGQPLLAEADTNVG